MCNFKCPNCKKSDHSGCDIQFVTAMYFEPHWVNGINVNPDRNTRSSQITCHSCHRVYSHSTNRETEKTSFIRKQKKKYVYKMSGEKTNQYYWN